MIAGTLAQPVAALFTFNGQMIFSGSRYQVNLTPLGTPDSGYFTVASNAVTVKNSGRYKVRASVQTGYQAELEIRRNGVQIHQLGTADASNGLANVSVPTNGNTDEITLNANDVLTVWMRNLNGAFGGNTSTFEVTFVPTPSYRR